MKFVRRHDFGPVQALELGWSLYGPPLMTCYCYYLDGVLIDSCQSRMQAVVADFIGDNRVGQVLLTHYHEDHTGNAAMIRARTGARIFGHNLTACKMARPFKIRPYQHYIWGRARPVQVETYPAEITIEKYRLRPIFTPGHSRDHTVYLEPVQGWLFSGDLYLGDRIKFFRSDERIAEQISSLQLVLRYDFEVLFCAHHPRIERGRQHLQAKLQFLQDVYGQVARLWSEGCEPGEIMSRMKITEVRGVQCLTMGNVSARNIVRSVIRAEQEAV